jgi:glycosyltransferase involved in cell wall biosynthesis
MSVGRPVLRTNTAGTAELIIEGLTGRSVPIDHEAFIEAAQQMLADRPRLERMGVIAAEHVRAHLTFDRQIDQTVGLYRRMVGEERLEGT